MLSAADCMCQGRDLPGSSWGFNSLLGCIFPVEGIPFWKLRGMSRMEEEGRSHRVTLDGATPGRLVA